MHNTIDEDMVLQRVLICLLRVIWAKLTWRRATASMLPP